MIFYKTSLCPSHLRFKFFYQCFHIWCESQLYSIRRSQLWTKTGIISVCFFSLEMSMHSTMKANLDKRKPKRFNFFIDIFSFERNNVMVYVPIFFQFVITSRILLVPVWTRSSHSKSYSLYSTTNINFCIMNTWTFLPFSFSFNEFCFQVIPNTRENKNSNEIMSLSRMIRVKVHSNTCRIIILTSIVWLLIYVVVLMNFVELLSTNTNRQSKYEDVVSSIQFSQLVCYQTSRLELRT